jgi:3-deoxy-manno-octulosonate cytidylyltransferase (CMP-KDO synthetase)
MPGIWLVLVPARLQSTRLPEKPLADLFGKPLIVRVVQNLAPLAQQGCRIIVATDSQRIVDICKKEGIQAELTNADHESGTDRCAELAKKFPHEYVLNVQGDEPFADLASLQLLMARFESSNDDIGTLAVKREYSQDFNNPNIVKLVKNSEGRAIYFSRSPIPYYRDSLPVIWWQHQGIYAYRKASLQKFVALQPSSLERMEKLEQLRAIEAGMSILAVESTFQSFGIDTPEDLARATSILREQK